MSRIMTLFEDREKSFEAKFRLDQETCFKLNVRRDKLLGMWAAEQLGLTGDAAKAYALSVVDAEFSEPDHDAGHKVVRDFAAAGVAITEETVRQQLLKMFETAREQILQEIEKK
jgi:hypothetical protein